MTQEFLIEVRSIVEPLLTRLGFQLDAFVDDVDEGGRLGSAVFYSTKDCKLQVYRSTRAGSVNCMIAPLGAPFVFGPYDQSKKWQDLPRFAIRQGIPVGAIMEDKLPVDFPTNSQQLEWVRGRVEKYFPVAHAGVLDIGKWDGQDGGLHRRGQTPRRYRLRHGDPTRTAMIYELSESDRTAIALAGQRAFPSQSNGGSCRAYRLRA